jgi:hypothetical protein
MEVGEVFSTTPRFTDVIISALRADGSTDLAVYVPAVLEMGAAGKTGLVLTNWASILAWAHGNGTTALQQTRTHHGPVAPDVLTHGTRLIDTAATGHLGIALRQTAHSARELGAQGTWDLIHCLARPMRPVLHTVGDHTRLQHCIDLITPAATSADLPHLAGPLGLTLAAVSHGHHHAAHHYLTATATTSQILTILLRVLATAFPDPTPPHTHNRPTTTPPPTPQAHPTTQRR